jgi:hypothetical protein
MSLWADCKEIWKNYGWHIVLGSIFLVLFILFLINQCSMDSVAVSVTVSDIYEYFLSLIFRPPVSRTRRMLARQSGGGGQGQTSRGEFQCKEFVEFYFQKPFDKIRPEFLKNPVTGENLELDMYNEDLKLAIEYNGSQHYHFNSFMHKNSRDRFQNQQYRDLIKRDLCSKEGIQLIIVPYTIAPDQIASFLFEEFKKLGLDPVATIT